MATPRAFPCLTRPFPAAATFFLSLATLALRALLALAAFYVAGFADFLSAFTNLANLALSAFKAFSSLAKTFFTALTFVLITPTFLVSASTVFFKASDFFF